MRASTTLWTDPGRSSGAPPRSRRSSSRNSGLPPARSMHRRANASAAAASPALARLRVEGSVDRPELIRQADLQKIVEIHLTLARKESGGHRLFDRGPVRIGSGCDLEDAADNRRDRTFALADPEIED